MLTGNVAEPHYQSVMLIDVPEEVQVYIKLQFVTKVTKFFVTSFFCKVLQVLYLLIYSQKRKQQMATRTISKLYLKFKDCCKYSPEIISWKYILKFLKETRSMHVNWENKVLMNIKSILSCIKSKKVRICSLKVKLRILMKPEDLLFSFDSNVVCRIVVTVHMLLHGQKKKGYCRGCSLLNFLLSRNLYFCLYWLMKHTTLDFRFQF